MPIDWQAVKEDVLKIHAQVSAELKDFCRENPQWIMTACGFTDYPPRIFLRFEHGAVADQRRTEEYTSSGIRLARPKPEEIEPMTELIAKLAREFDLRASPNLAKFEGGAPYEFVYTLKPHYKRYEKAG